MMAFLASLLQYVVIFIILAGIGVLGGFLGVKLRKRKDAKLAEEAQGIDNAPKEEQ